MKEKYYEIEIHTVSIILYFTANEWTHPKYLYKGVSSTSKNEEDWSL